MPTVTIFETTRGGDISTRSVDPGAPRGAPPVDPERANPHEDDYRLTWTPGNIASVEIDAFRAPDCRVTHV